MNTTEIFEVLGIEATKDLDAITAAYREELKKHHPEEDPEGFQKVRKAYEEARAYASKAEDEPQGYVGDVNLAGPINEYLITLGNAYEDFTQRIDPKKWEQLLSHPVLDDFEHGAQAKKETMRFFMDHYWLPIPVWKVLDQKFLIKEQQTELLEYLPQDFLEFVLDKLIEGKLDFPYSEITGYPERDTEGKIDRFVQGVVYAVSPNNEKVQPDVMKEIKDSGMDHPWVRLLECLVEDENGQKAWLAKSEEEKAEILKYCDELVDSEYGKATIGYRAWEVKAVDAMDKGGWRDAFFFYRNMLYIFANQTSMDGSIESGNKLIDLFMEKDELDERACEVFLVACDMCDQSKKGIEYFKQHENQKKKTAPFYALYSVILRKEGRFIEAMKCIEKAEQMGDDSFDFKKLKLAVFKDKRDFENVERYANAVLEENDRDFGALLDLQEAYEAKGNDKGVVDIFYRAREIYQYEPKMYVRAAEAFMRHENYADAVRVLEDGQQAGAHSDEMDYTKDLAKAYWAARDEVYLDAVELIQPYFDEHPNLILKACQWYRDAYNNGCNYTLAHQQKAIEMVENYAKRCGEDENVFRARAYLHAALGDVKQAVACCEAGIRYMKTKKNKDRVYQRRMMLTFYEMTGTFYQKSSHKMGAADGELALGNFKKAIKAYENAYRIIYTDKFFDVSARLISDWGELYLLHGKYASGIFRMKTILNTENQYNRTQDKSGFRAAHEQMGRLLLAQGLKRMGRLALNRSSEEKNILVKPQGEFDLGRYVDKIRKGFEYLIWTPDAFTMEEKGSFLQFMQGRLLTYVNSDMEQSGPMLDLILHVARFFPNFTTDLGWLYDALRSERVVKLFDDIASETGYYKYWEYLLRIAVFTQDQATIAEIAEHFKKAAEAQQGYCVENKVSLEESINDKRFTHRLECFDLAVYYACIGDMAKAREYAGKMCSAGVCQFCRQSGCEDYYNVMAFLAFMEKNDAELERWVNLCDKHLWHHHEPFGRMLLVQKNKRAF